MDTIVIVLSLSLLFGTFGPVAVRAQEHDDGVAQQQGNTASTLRYEAPDDCQWWIREPSVAGVPEEVALACRLRTINSEFDTTNFSVIPSEHTTSLRVVCSDTVMSRSALDERSLAHLWRLRELVLDHCKLGHWPAGTLAGLRDLRNLTVRTRNTDWPAMSLDLAPGAFAPVRQLERLDLSRNNMWTLPPGVFCPLTNLVALNVSHNRLQDVGDLGFRERGAAVPPARRVSPEAEESEGTAAVSVATPQPPPAPCPLDVRSLDASHNHFVLVPGAGFGALRRLRELRLHDNEISMVADRALSGLRALQLLDLSDNKVVALPAELFRECSATLQQLYLRNNSISVLAPGLFGGLGQLQALDLSRNQLTSAWLNSDTFSGLIRLVQLNLSHNRVARVEPALFRDLYTLQILDLRHNQLETVPADTFSPMSNLHTLLLSNNRLAYLDAYSLNGLYVLSLLALDANSLRGLHPEAFRNCSSLQDLNLNGNALTTVPLALKDLRLLRTVDLGENQIAALDEPGFRGLHSLYGLRLIGNRIAQVGRAAFADLPALQILNLARNRIGRVEPGAFQHNLALQAVRLDSNLLADVGGLFPDLPALVWLNVSDNRLEWFDYALVPSGLQWLDLHANRIAELGNRRGADSELRLQTLDASFNRLTRVTAAAVPAGVELLFLNDNLISTVEAHAFLRRPNLTRVDLYANQLTTLQLSALRLTPVAPDRPLPEFYIGGNPFHCDCTMEWLQRVNKLDHLRQHPRVMDLDSVYCRLLYSRERAFVPLLRAEPAHFLCPYETHCFALCHCCDFDACDCEMTCPENCTCYHDQSWAANVVDCSAAGYADMPANIPMDATEVYLDGNSFGELSSHAFIGRKNLRVLYANDSGIAAVYNHTFSGLRRLSVLHLERNRIRRLLGSELAALESLRELYLQHNRLEHVAEDAFLPLRQLEVLRLDGNRLGTFAVWQLALNPYLVDVTLSENPWRCACSWLGRARTWLRAHRAKVSDGTRVSCTGTNLGGWNGTCGLHAAADDDDDAGARALAEGGRSLLRGRGALALAAVGAALAGVAAAVLVAFRFRRELRAWMYGRCGLRLCHRRDAASSGGGGGGDGPGGVAGTVQRGDKDRPYDAYVAYSARDDAWVRQVLAPGLEGSEPPYRLCLHYRDCGGGVSSFLADTVLEAAEAARRTLLVLSPNFVRHEWCRFEFKSALREALQRRRGRHALILVLAGDVAPRDLDPELRLCLKAATVVRWGDRQFWHKLRYAMPDPRPREEECVADAGALSRFQTPVEPIYHHHHHHHHNHHQDERRALPPVPARPASAAAGRLSQTMAPGPPCSHLAVGTTASLPRDARVQPLWA